MAIEKFYTEAQKLTPEEFVIWLRGVLEVLESRDVNREDLLLIKNRLNNLKKAPSIVMRDTFEGFTQVKGEGGKMLLNHATGKQEDLESLQDSEFNRQVMEIIIDISTDTGIVLIFTAIILAGGYVLGKMDKG